MILVLYLKYYTTPHQQFEVLQADLSNLKLSNLLEKSPIIINDEIVNPHTVVDTMFKYLFVKQKSFLFINTRYNPYVQNTHRFLLLYASSDLEIQIVHPNLYNNGKPSYILMMPVKKHQMVIVPMFWWYALKGRAFAIELDSMFSIFYNMIIHRA